MARMRFSRSYNFDSATRQLDSRDLDDAGDPTTDMGAAMEALLGQYGALDLQPAYPGLDIMEGQITGPLSQIGDDFSGLAAVMDRASGYEDYPATLPSLGAWVAAGDYKVRWNPTNPGLYQWYVMQEVVLNTTAHANTWIGFRPPLPAIVDETWGGDIDRAVRVDDVTFRSRDQGMLMASQEMIDAGWGGLNVFGPRYEIAGAETVSENNLVVVILSWSPAGTVPYLGDI